MTTSLDSVCRVLGYGLDDHVSWYAIVYEQYWGKDWTTTFLVSVCTVLEHGLDDHVSW